MRWLTDASPRVKARMAGAFWLTVFVTGSLALYLGEGDAASASNIVSSVCYTVVTLLLYDLLKPVNGSMSLVAACFGLAGCVVTLFGLTRFILVRDLAIFGFHCLLVGLLILRSTFLPRFLGAFMVFAGLGWLTFLWPPLSRYLFPYNMMPGMLGEGLLLLWLLVMGVDVRRWKQQANAAAVTASS